MKQPEPRDVNSNQDADEETTLKTHMQTLLKVTDADTRKNKLIELGPELSQKALPIPLTLTM